MEAMVERNLFTGYSVGTDDPVSASHLQFADDTLLMGTKSWANVRALRAALVLFKAMPGLKVNFNKSMLVGVNIPDSWLGWQSRFLSFGGRLVLLKSVLTSLPVYALSFFKAPSRKWCWRMLVERDSLWFRVLVARYGLERGRLCAGGGRGSTWWRELVRIRDGGGELGGGWIRENIMRKVGDGLLEVGAVREAWVWRRPLRVWEEEMLRECQALLLTVSMQDHSTDSWQWQPELDSGYIVRGAYQILTDQVVAPLDVAEGLIWHPQVPLKVSILAWRLLRNRLPTKSNLITRGILPTAAHFCVSGRGEAESAHHLFLSCSTFGSLWPMVVLVLGDLSCNSYGLSACGLCGQSGIIVYSKAQQILYLICWTRSRPFLTGGYE
ncbi:hypothetical protein TSUD_183460 [Trifolium subterraneum]|uniref:Reverse transcriptase domain-containing protein n=1 Tax=Trifolium subterraneum TaxID=3900 RepID=A0A2Z6NJJ3_TRISU|nr:hypothetical protein TSUD_183460 [Trifolium subterraneum]